MESKPKKIILVDMDNVICNFDEKIMEEAQNQYGLSPPNRIHHLIGENYPQPELIQKIYRAKGFILTLNPYPGAIEALKRLDQKYDVYLLSAPAMSIYNPSEKFQWVLENLGESWWGKVILTYQKTLVYGDILIDDAPIPFGNSNVKPNWIHILYDQPFNQSTDHKYRGTWENIEKIIEEIFANE